MSVPGRTFNGDGASEPDPGDGTLEAAVASETTPNLVSSLV
jgi:hypothetical protein